MKLDGEKVRPREANGGAEQGGRPVRVTMGGQYRRRSAWWCLAASACLVSGMIAVVVGSASPGASAPGFTDLWAALALIPMLLSAGNMHHARYGPAVAWGYVALPPLALSALLAVHSLHLSGLLGLKSCDAMADDCGVAPLGLWLPLILFVASGVLLAISLEMSKVSDAVHHTS